MASKSFDDIIRSAIEAHKEGLPDDAWDLFESSVAAHDFDQQINHKVADHQLEVFPKDWDVLSDKVERTEVMNEFDALIGSKLAGISIDDTPDWDQFEQLLEEDDVFDQQIADKINEHTVPSAESQWPKLSEHLERVERRRRRIVITKFVEAAVFLLFVISIMQLYPVHNIGKESPFRTHSVQAELKKNNKSLETAGQMAAVDKNNQKDDLLSPSGENQISTDNNLGQIASILGRSANADAILLQSVSEVISASPFDQRAKVELEKINLPPIPDFESNVDRHDNLIASTYLQGTDDAYLEKGSLATNVEAFENSAVNNATLLTSLDPKAIAFERPEFYLPVSDLGAGARKGQWWLNVYGAPETNFVNTPYDNYYEVESYQSLSNGYALGATVSYSLNDMEFETGLAYSTLSYEPREIIEITGNSRSGFVESSLKEIIFDIVEIPLNFKYKFFKKKGWTVYTNSGLSGAIVASAAYDKKTHASVLALASPGTSNNVNSTLTILDKKEFDPGLLNRGSKIENNIFATLNTGFGVSKDISDNISFYAQPTYHHNLSTSGIGPNNDLHNRMSLQIGTKVRL